MAPLLSSIRAIVFDLGDTIFHTVRHDREAGIRRLLAHAEGARGVSVDMLAEKGRSIDRRLETSSAAEATEYRQTDFHRILYGSFGITLQLDELEAERLYWDHSLSFELEDGIGEVLNRIEELGIRMAVISNAVFSPMTLSHELEKHGLCSYFEFVISSADYGIRKPDPLLFELAERRLGLKASECLYVGNLVHVDVEGALRAGWHPLWYAAAAVKDGSYTAQTRQLPEAVPSVQSWTEFLSHLSQEMEV